MRKYTFFYHYYKQYDEMSVHFRGTCSRVKNIDCRVPCLTIWNKTQPYLVMKGKATEVRFEENKAIIV